MVFYIWCSKIRLNFRISGRTFEILVERLGKWRIEVGVWGPETGFQILLLKEDGSFEDELPYAEVKNIKSCKKRPKIAKNIFQYFPQNCKICKNQCFFYCCSHLMFKNSYFLHGFLDLEEARDSCYPSRFSNIGRLSARPSAHGLLPARPPGRHLDYWALARPPVGATGWMLGPFERLPARPDAHAVPLLNPKNHVKNKDFLTSGAKNHVKNKDIWSSIS